MAFTESDIEKYDRAAAILGNQNLLLCAIRPKLELEPNGSVSPLKYFNEKIKEMGIDPKSVEALFLEEAYLGDLEKIMKKAEEL